MFENLRLEELRKNDCVVLRAPSSTRPAIWRVEREGKRAVVKDFSGNRFFFRNLVGRFLIWRESKAYGELREIPGIPEFYGVIDGLALVVEEVPGTSLEHFRKRTKLPNAFFDGLQELLDECHRRGVAHCDLKRAPNLLMGRDGRPYIVDWAASVLRKEFRFFPLTLVYRRFVLDDQMAVTKLKLRHLPDSVSSEERERYYRRGAAEKTIRYVRDGLRKWLKKIA